MHTQESDDEQERRGLAFTGNSPIGGEYARGRLKTPEETTEGRIELHFAKQGLDIRIEAINEEQKTILFSACCESDYLIGKQFLIKEGWTITFDSTRILQVIEYFIYRCHLNVQIKSMAFERRHLVINSNSSNDYAVAKAYLQRQGWEVSTDSSFLY